ncbi:MAG TPA: cysteine desulfurase family protein [Acidimicrobiales bacterium]|nr:cysteine desulfurase family protein [Acidimicrobiales bacterium]
MVYLDHAATTPLRPEALQAMLPYLTEHYGNPSGAHSIARVARTAVDDARERVAGVLGCDAGDVVFTSGGTESCNLAIQGVHRARGGALLCSAVEHHAVLDTVRSCGGTTVPVDGRGRVDLDALADHLHPGVTLVSVMAANNEVGVLEPIDAVAALVRRHAPDAVLHVDAVAAAPWVDPAVVASVADMVSVSGHKFGGPKGVGVLAVRRGTPAPLLFGGGQERERRPGTHNVAGIVGMAAALEVSAATRLERGASVADRRDRLEAALVESGTGVRRTVEGAVRLPGISHLVVDGVDQEELLLLLDDAGICASGGSACASGAMQPSHVLLAMGMSTSEARSALRLSLGYTTTEAEIDTVIDVVPKVVEQLRR